MKLPIVIRTVSIVLSRKFLSVNSKPLVYHLRKLQTLSPIRFYELPAWGSKKHKNKQKLKIQFTHIMADPKIEEILAPFRASVKEQVFYLQYFDLE